MCRLHLCVNTGSAARVLTSQISPLNSILARASGDLSVEKGLAGTFGWLAQAASSFSWNTKSGMLALKTSHEMKAIRCVSEKSAFTAITASALTESHVCTSWPLVPPIHSRTLIILRIRLRWCRANVYRPNIRPFRIPPPHKMCSLSWFCCHVLCSKSKYS